MKKLDKNKRRFADQDERDGGHLYKRLRNEQQRKSNSELDRMLKQKNFNYRPRDDDYDYL